MSEAPTTQEPPVTQEAPPPQPETQEEKALRDLQSDMQLAMVDLLTGLEMRHSVNPAASDFTNAAAVDPDELLSILTNWHNQGIVFSKVPNDDFATDGVQYRWKLNWNGYLAARDLSAPVAVLTSISPTSGKKSTTVTITATGTTFDETCYIASRASMSAQQFISATQLSADAALGNTTGPMDVVVCSQRWGTITDPQTLTITP